MENWKQSLKDSIVSPDRLAELFPVDAEALKAVAGRYPMRITPHYLGLIREVGDPIWRQCVPDLRELNDPNGMDDPLGEENLSPVPGLVHRYADRAVLLVSGSCAVYCRFCTRKRTVGCGAMALNREDFEAALDYLGGRPEIRDVILSGGDPLLLENDRLEALLESLYRIPHVEMVRIGTRVPVTLPERITEGLCARLRRFSPLYVNTHFNHPREITPEASAACARLFGAGIPLGNQTVLLRGVNDDPAVLAELFRGLLKIRVRPYYLHHMDPARGTSHFRIRIERGLDLLKTLRGPLSGMAVPQYVVDLPGGKGKAPLLPEYVELLGEKAVIRSPGDEPVEVMNEIFGGSESAGENLRRKSGERG